MTLPNVTGCVQQIVVVIPKSAFCRAAALGRVLAVVNSTRTRLFIATHAYAEEED